jgi:NUMOD4 motif-containing protein/HNH endonuclease
MIEQDVEVWLPIENCPKYEVSNMGRIRNSVTKRIRKIQVGGNGYCQFGVYCDDKKAVKTMAVHRAVAKAFIPNANNKPMINHKNSVRTDNRVENIEWVNGSENCLHAYKNGNIAACRGVGNPHNKLTEKQVIEIYGSNEGRKDLAERYGVTISSIDKIRYGIYWTHLTKKAIT